MASGDILAIFLPAHNEPPSASFATLDTRNSRPVLDFDQTSVEAAVFRSESPPTCATGFGASVEVHWSATGITSGAVVWRASVERIDSGTLDVDGDSFASAVTAAATNVPGTDGVTTKTTIAMTNAQLDALLKNEDYRLKIERVPTDGGDTAAADAELHRVSLIEA